jgi:hypothetical protein
LPDPCDAFRIALRLNRRERLDERREMGVRGLRLIDHCEGFAQVRARTLGKQILPQKIRLDQRGELVAVPFLEGDVALRILPDEPFQRGPHRLQNVPAATDTDNNILAAMFVR